jgi:hypothetical protein
MDLASWVETRSPIESTLIALTEASVVIAKTTVFATLVESDFIPRMIPSECCKTTLQNLRCKNPIA